ncbi:Chitobiosyldiphosphodolichol beta-mannosyltransferase [Zancudomyces culisetae]|uniref:Chitobiosyldiphosphodolichol beta-mannosyltransferase n=2 Tax=Zancudomyces culisetae TaxID=1213189 RepID=A0A1R1PLW0_ZANCU|nr:Chitobiosyldiphosphodolichol beta-mannosyltransferase [Zancudomyces culisetae]|eukprot:OMH81927.1 Chitobiosyldiphosphodolichol beta-mannosyltransferase [Zancudomyces culisetae]
MPQGKNGTKNSKVQKRKKGSEQKLPDKEKTDTPAKSNCVEPNLDQEQTERKASGTSEKGTQSEPYSSGNEQSKNVKQAQGYEKFIGKMADYNIAVTKAMADDLQRNWGLRGKIIVLCDKPPKEFHRLSQDESKLFWRTFFLSEAAANIPKKFSSFMSKQTESNGNSVMKFTGKNDNKTAILVSSTSWTKDEDFDILLDALKQYDLAVTNTGNDSSYPNILVIITGKGPGKELFKKKVSLTELNKVHITTAWLPAEDYPKLLGCSDLGVSLHTSSSGLDLPMKVVDMFGCGLPVLAYNFDCLNELVVDGKNGYVFRDCEDLCSKLMVSIPFCLLYYLSSL